MLDSTLESLHQLLCGTPSPATWERLLTVFEAWPEGDDLEVGLDYASDHLAAWPNAERCVAGDRARAALTSTRPSWWPLVRRLDLSHLGLQSKALPPLNEAPFEHLTELDLSDNELGDEGLAALTNGAAPNLSTLELEHNGLGDEGIRSLCHWELPSLRELVLARQPIGPKSARRLAKWPSLAGIEALDLTETKVGSKGIVALGDSPHLASLRRLRLSRCWIKDRSLRAVLDGPAPLAELSLHATRMTDDALRALAAWPRLSGLRDLFITADKFTDAGVVTLIEAEGLAGIEALYVAGHDGVGAASCRAVARAKHLRSLRKLCISGRRLVDEVALISLTDGLPALEHLDSDPHVSLEVWEAFIRAKQPHITRAFLAGQTLDMMKPFARQKGLRGVSGMRRGELIEAIMAQLRPSG